MALSADVERAYSLGSENTVPVKASSVVYKGSAVGYTAGYGRGLVAGDKFAGFALEAKTGGSSNGDVNVQVREKGIIQLDISSAAITDIGKVVYASDDGTFTFTQGSNSRVGIVRRWISTGVVEVEYNATDASSVGTSIAALTENSGAIGGTNDGDIPALVDPNGDAGATVIAGIRECADKINQILAALN